MNEFTLNDSEMEQVTGGVSNSQWEERVKYLMEKKKAELEAQVPKESIDQLKEYIKDGDFFRISLWFVINGKYAIVHEAESLTTL